ncbi:unnamed protein product [Prunus armeniaca]
MPFTSLLIHKQNPSFNLRPSAPSIIRHVRPPMIQNRPSAFGHPAFGHQPSAIQDSAISLRPSAFGHSVFGHRHHLSFGTCDVFTSPPMIRNRPSAFGIQPSAIQPLAIQPSAIGTFYHSARAMSSHPPNDSESAFSLRPSSLRPFSIRPFSLRPSAFGHQNRPSAFGHSAFGHSAFGHPSFGYQPSAISLRPFSIPPFSLRPSAFGHSAFGPSAIQPSAIQPSSISLRPSAFGHSAFGHQPSAIGTFHHSERAMSSHPPNDSESAFGHRNLPSFGFLLT